MKHRYEILDLPVVLLVKDEPLVRLTQVDLLREAGFWVVEAQDADEAFDLLRARPDIDVVLTDVDMPGSLDGFEFARLVRQGWPEVGVLVISGKMTPRPGDLPPGTAFVAKPVRPAMLARHLREAMDLPKSRRPGSRESFHPAGEGASA
ncbi:response regulator [Microvirga massiliensis]|uniref:response regulator n=1 Tax=Microvirga massiliensis TaxID=1033741 RepID=UPI00062B7401|nr:response regulator [Microvirga massiliensis]